MNDVVKPIPFEITFSNDLFKHKTIINKVSEYFYIKENILCFMRYKEVCMTTHINISYSRKLTNHEIIAS